MAQMQVQVDPVDNKAPPGPIARKIKDKKAQIEDAVQWRDDLQMFDPTPNELFNASNYITLLRGDLEKLEKSKKGENENGKA